MTASYVRLPPNSREAEEAAVGCLLLDEEAIATADLAPADFFYERCREIYQACQAVHERREPVNAITVGYELAMADRLEAVGGHAYLSYVANAVPSSTFFAHYAGVVRQTALRRSLIAVAGQVAALGYEGGPDAESLIAKAEDLLHGIGSATGTSGFVPVRQAVSNYLDGLESRSDAGSDGHPHLWTGFRSLDHVLGGLHRSDLVILAARPGMGKTSLALAIGEYVTLHQGARVALFSLEMGQDQLVERLIASASGIDVQRIRQSRLGAVQLSDDEDRRFIEAVAAVSELRIEIDDSSMPTVAEIRRQAWKAAAGGVDLIIVDYLQLIRSQDGDRENRAQQMGEISRALKGLARDLDVPVLALAQLSRAVEQRMPHLPQLSDLRDSGTIEQDADVVLFIYREDYYVTEEEWCRRFPTRKYPQGIANVIVAKHRNGPTGQVDLYFHGPTAKFYSLSGRAEPTR